MWLDKRRYPRAQPTHAAVFRSTNLRSIRFNVGGIAIPAAVALQPALLETATARGLGRRPPTSPQRPGKHLQGTIAPLFALHSPSYPGKLPLRRKSKILLVFQDEPAADQVEELLTQAAAEKHQLLLSIASGSEIYHHTMRRVSQEAAEQTARELAALPIEIVGVGDDLPLAKQAAIYKARHKMACANCFAAAMAEEKKAELVTGDSEFKALEKEIKINWLK